jgi:hypothetical protein
VRIQLLPTGSDRSFRHQLTFEMVTSGLLLIVVSRQWLLVLVAGGIWLPAVRSTWLSWILRSLAVLSGRPSPNRPQRGPRTRT